MKKIIKSLLIFGVGLWLFFGIANQVMATTTTTTNRSDFDLGLFNNTESKSKEGEIRLTPDGAWGPRVWKTPKVTLSNQTGITSDGTYIYVLASYDRFFTRYIPSENRWQTLANAPHVAYAGTDLVVLGNYVYAVFGGYQKYFSRYNINTNTWENLLDFPDLTADGATLGTNGTYIYALRGAWTTDFWVYDTVANTWTPLASAPATIQQGANLVYNNGIFYTPRGYAGDFYQYEVSTNTWTAKASLPSALYYYNQNIDIRGNFIYVLRYYNNVQEFYKYSISGNTWSNLTIPPQISLYVGVVYNSSDDMLYVFRGNGSYDFWKFNPTTEAYVGPPELLTAPSTGADLVYYNNYLFQQRGANTLSFYRYNIVAGTWESRADSLVTFNDATRGVAAGSYLYYFQGSSLQTFYRYDPAGNSWLQMGNPPNTVGHGAALVYPGSGDFIYATRGLSTRSFWRYSISGNSWDDPVVTDLPDNTEASYGAAMVATTTDIYYMSGYGIPAFLVYNIAGNSWTSLTNVPFAPYAGSDLAIYSGKIYAQSGNYKNDLWVYTIASPANGWRYLSPMDNYGLTEIGPWAGGSIESDASGNLYSIYGSTVGRMSIYTPSANNYKSTGTWTSNSLDLTYVSAWSSVGTSTSVPTGASISLETRSSSDQATWSGWAALSANNIASPTNRYLQLKATLNSTVDYSQTPSLQAITVNFLGDTTPPPNPVTITGLSQQVGGSSITTGGSYKHAHPYFSWTAPTDGQTSVTGYYVYFGTSSTGDPTTAGNYQTGTSYTVTTPMANGSTYYLRIQTKDTVGNISSAETLFTYVYSGVESANITMTLTTDFSGITSNSTAVNNSIKLLGKSGFWLQDRLSLAPASINYDSDFAYVNSTNKLYIMRGTATKTFYEYDIATDVWTTKADTPETVYYGGKIVEGPTGYLYALRGYKNESPAAATISFWRYDIVNNTWSDAAATDIPQTVLYGGSLVYDGNRYIYALRGNGDDAFYVYDTTGNTWTALTNIDFGAPITQTNNLVNNGADLAYDGAGKVYAIQGGARTGFAYYDTSLHQWTVLPDLPYGADYGSKIEYDTTTNAIYYLAASGRNFFYKYDISSETWSELTEAPYTMTTGSAFRNVNGTFYVIRGGGTTGIYKYNIAKASWYMPTVGMFGGWFRGSDARTFSYGSNIIKGDGDNYYLTRGAFDNLFIRYNATTGVSTQMADAPAGFYYHGRLLYVPNQNKIYATIGNIYSKFFVYDIAGDSWSEITTDPLPVDAYLGSSLVYDGSQYIFFSGGNGTSFYRYDTLGDPGTRWLIRAVFPASVSYGGQMVYKGGYIYATRGNNQLGFYRYDPGANSWNDVNYADLPTGATIYNDGFLVDGFDGYLYACRGGNTKGCYKYSISGNQWTDITTTLTPYIYYGGAGTSNGSDRLLVLAGAAGYNTFTNGIYTYIQQTDNSSFEESGNYTSQVHDLTNVYRFTNLSVGLTTPSNTTVSAYTKTSADNVTWSDWTQATEEKSIGQTKTYLINSTANRYAQVKFTMTSADGIYSPTIYDYTINYYQDITPPINPTSLSSYKTLAKATNIVSGTWYNSSAPLFVWPEAEAAGGATDTAAGSGVSGYYVYFGNLVAGSVPFITGNVQVGASYAPTLTSNGTSYLRITTKDDAGNNSSSWWDAFTYKYDGTVPTAPTTLNVSPSSYTATNNFAFSWSGATDSDSGIEQYCYKTSGTTESCSDSDEAYETEEVCTSEITVTNIEAGCAGTNTFSVRTKDYAGNYSSSYKQASFYYTTDAPGAPQNVRVTDPVGTAPVHNTKNWFAFAWDAPSAFKGEQSNLRYYYSFNALPTSNNVNEIGLSVTYLSAGAYDNIQKGENVFYVVAKDEAGNIDYVNYGHVHFFADTTAPDVPINLDVSDVSIKETSSWRLALSWDAPVASGSGIANYKVYRSATTAASCTTNLADFTYVASTSQTSYVDTGLTQSTKYYCIKACDSTNECSTTSSTVSLYPDGKWRVAPTLVASPSATIKTKSAIIAWSTSRTSNSFVKYGKSSGSYGAEVGSSTQITSHEITLTGLDPGTKYYYKALWTDEDGNTGQTDELTLTTNAAPSISLVSTTNISIYSAYVTFTVKNGIKATIKYGKTTTYGSTESISTSKSESSYTVALTNLIEGTIYHLQIDSEDEEGNKFSSDDYSFQTLPVPKILTLKVQQVAGMPTATLRLLWTSNALISSIVTYYPTNNPERTLDSISLALKRSHEVILKNLADNTDYTLLIKGKDSAGNETKTEQKLVKTANDLRPPEISNMNVESTIVGVGEEAKAQVNITWDTDEPSTTQIEYAQGTGNNYGQTTQEDTSLTTNHSVTIPDLSPAKIYHLRAISKDKASNAGMSFDTVVVTPKSTKDALSLVIDNLSKTFGFLKGTSIK